MNEKIIDLVGYKFNNYAKLKLDLILSKLNEMVNDELGYKISVYKKKIYIVQNKWSKQFHFFKFIFGILWAHIFFYVVPSYVYFRLYL